MKDNKLDGATGTKKEIKLVKIERLLDNNEEIAVSFTWQRGITLGYAVYDYIILRSVETYN
jgi:hypothetical protein